MILKKGVITIGGIIVLNVNSNPSLNGGVSAPIGSCACCENGDGLFYKIGAGNTDWVILNMNYLSNIIKKNFIENYFSGDVLDLKKNPYFIYNISVNGRLLYEDIDYEILDTSIIFKKNYENVLLNIVFEFINN